MLSGTLGPALATALSDPPVPANHQTALRLLCNSFKSQHLRTWVLSQLPSLLEALSASFSSSAKTIRGLVSAFLLSSAISGRSENFSDELVKKLLEKATELLKDASGESPVITSIRVYVCIFE